MRRIFNYIRPSFEDEGGKFSYKRATQFVLTWLIISMIGSGITLTTLGFYTFCVIVGLFSVILGAITVPQLITLVASLRGLKVPEVTKTKDDEKTDSSATPDGSSNDLGM